MPISTAGRPRRRRPLPPLLGICCGLLLAGVSACAGTPPTGGGPGERLTAAPTGIPTRDAPAGIADAEPADGDGFSRHVNGLAGFVANLLKTYTTDPVMRPVSTLRSLGFLLTDTLTDFADRTVIDTVRLPELARTPIPPVAAGPGMDLGAWERELDAITGSRPSRGTIEFLVDGEEYFSSLVDSIERAKRSIHIRTYIFDNDDVAVEIADLLKRRSSEIDVRVAMDGIGTLTGGILHSPSMPADFEPPASIAEYLRSGSDVHARTLTNPWFTGDHSKVTIVDRKVAYLGGMNIGREYRFDWHDLMVRLEGEIVEELARDSDRAWARSGLLGDIAALVHPVDGGPPTAAPASGYPVRVLRTRAEESQIYDAKLAAIRRAKKYIYIENPYFSDDAILYELIAARRRGVDVRFVIAERGDAALMDMSNAQAINAMLENGIRVYMYPGMTHVKAAIVDDWLMIGSANLDKLSLRVNKEINVATSHPGTVTTLRRRVFEADFAKSVELDRKLPTSTGHRFAEAVADFLL